jgi:RNA polymerase sigma-70 factor (ECF subfamily)
MVAFNLSPAPLTLIDATASLAPVSGSRADAEYDAKLVARVKTGDDDAFAEIVSRHRAKLFAVAFARLRNHADAEEIAQDTLIRAHRALDRFRGESSLATWLHRIAVNLSLNRHWYFFRRRRHLTQSLDCPLGDDTRSTLADIMPSEEPGPARQTMNREYSEVVLDCITKLPPHQSAILRLRSIQERSYDEIARSLGINVGTVKSRIARARENLHVLIAKTCPEFAVESCGAQRMCDSRGQG